MNNLRHWLRLTVCGAALVLIALSGMAQTNNRPAIGADPALERRVQALSYQLRCLVCQNETIAESHAPLAQDLRQQVREQLAAGKSEREVTEFMVQRYGDFVLYNPPVKATTWLLWFGPGVLLLLALAWLWFKLKRRAQDPLPVLTEEQQRQAQALLQVADSAAEADNRTPS